MSSNTEIQNLFWKLQFAEYVIILFCLLFFKIINGQIIQNSISIITFHNEILFYNKVGHSSMVSVGYINTDSTNFLFDFIFETLLLVTQ